MTERNVMLTSDDYYERGGGKSVHTHTFHIITLTHSTAYIYVKKRQKKHDWISNAKKPFSFARFSFTCALMQTPSIPKELFAASAAVVVDFFS